jgi:hypothetical protein
MHPCFEPLSRSKLPSTTSVAQPASPEPQRLPSVETQTYRGNAKSPGSAVLCRAKPYVRALRCESRGVGHPPNFVRVSIEGEHKFGGWISQGWVPSSAVAGIDGRANIPRKCKIARKCDPSVWIGRERVATVQKSRGGSSSKLCQSVYRRRTQVWRMDLAEVGVAKRGLEESARVRPAGARQLQGSVCEVTGVRR